MIPRNRRQNSPSRKMIEDDESGPGRNMVRRDEVTDQRNAAGKEQGPGGRADNLGDRRIVMCVDLGLRERRGVESAMRHLAFVIDDFCSAGGTGPSRRHRNAQASHHSTRVGLIDNCLVDVQLQII